MQNIQGKYIKDENGNVISPIVSTDTIYNGNGTGITKFTQSYKIPATTGSSYGWYKVLKGNIDSDNHYQNCVVVLSVMDLFDGECGTMYINVRRDLNTISISSFKWLNNTGFNNSHFVLQIENNDSFVLYQYSSTGYHTHSYKIIQSYNLEYPYYEDIVTFFQPDHTDIVSTPIGQIIDSEKSACKCEIHEDYSKTTTSDEKIPLYIQWQDNMISGFTSNDGGIYCRKPGTIQVHASLYFHQGVTGVDKWVGTIVKKGDGSVITSNYMTYYAWYKTSQCSGLFPVNAGDTIYLYAGSGLGDVKVMSWGAVTYLYIAYV